MCTPWGRARGRPWPNERMSSNSQSGEEWGKGLVKAPRGDQGDGVGGEESGKASRWSRRAC